MESNLVILNSKCKEARCRSLNDLDRGHRRFRANISLTFDWLARDFLRREKKKKKERRNSFGKRTGRHVDIDMPPFSIAAMLLTGSCSCNLWCSWYCCCYHTEKHDALSGWYRRLRTSTLYKRAGIGLSPLYLYVYVHQETLKSPVRTSCEAFEPDLLSYLKILSVTRTYSQVAKIKRYTDDPRGGDKAWPETNEN